MKDQQLLNVTFFTQSEERFQFRIVTLLTQLGPPKEYFLL